MQDVQNIRGRQRSSWASPAETCTDSSNMRFFYSITCNRDIFDQHDFLPDLPSPPELAPQTYASWQLGLCSKLVQGWIRQNDACDTTTFTTDTSWEHVDLNSMNVQTIITLFQDMKSATLFMLSNIVNVVKLVLVMAATNAHLHMNVRSPRSADWKRTLPYLRIASTISWPCTYTRKKLTRCHSSLFPMKLQLHKADTRTLDTTRIAAMWK